MLQWGHSFSAVEMALNTLAKSVSRTSPLSNGGTIILAYAHASFIYSEEYPRFARAH